MYIASCQRHCSPWFLSAASSPPLPGYLPQRLSHSTSSVSCRWPGSPLSFRFNQDKQPLPRTVQFLFNNIIYWLILEYTYASGREKSLRAGDNICLYVSLESASLLTGHLCSVTVMENTKVTTPQHVSTEEKLVIIDKVKYQRMSAYIMAFIRLFQLLRAWICPFHLKILCTFI